MTGKIAVSVIICTYNRAADLSATLEALARVIVPADADAELIVVDNASTDNTRQVVHSRRLPDMPVRYLHEPRRGKSNAYNTGLAAARGQVVLFTDDDVHPPREWISEMCAPITEGRADAVAGGVRIAPHLERLWMENLHRLWLADTDAQDSADWNLIGANMAFRRKVLDRVPLFDPELGPGALGFGEDSLFSMQLKETGFQIVAPHNVCAEHYFDAARLSRTSFLSRMNKEGVCQAYISHHWDQTPINFGRRSVLRSACLLAYRRLRLHNEWRQPEGMPPWEMRLLLDLRRMVERLRLHGQPCNYEKRGLVKRNGVLWERLTDGVSAHKK